MAFFEGNNMTGGYGNGPDIINSCSVNVEKGEIVSILGPNGAGKSTAMKAMLGLLNLKSGSVIINGKDISNLSPQDRVKEGISFVPQTKNVFAGMTVEENLEMGAFLINSDYNSVIDEIYDNQEVTSFRDRLYSLYTKPPQRICSLSKFFMTLTSMLEVFQYNDGGIVYV